MKKEEISIFIDEMSFLGDVYITIKLLLNDTLFLPHHSSKCASNI